MEATISKKSAAEFADEAIEAFRKMHVQNKSEKASPAPKAPLVEIRHVGASAGAVVFCVVAYWCFGIAMSSLFPTHMACGTIKIKNRPLANASVMFQCSKSKKAYSHKTDENGKYKIETPHGTFKVMVMGDDEIPGRYMNPTQTPLKADVFHDVTLDFSLSDK
ncbi:carboxypeptidase regulatory-like domain-containing protein [bacterium]|nr:carboxypeptidase regulatory-like domain-containing protein [bacterium]